jgi:hypothetical protein
MSQLQVEEDTEGKWVLLKLTSDGTWDAVSEHATKADARRAQQDYLVMEQYS